MTYTFTTIERGTWRLDATDVNEPFLVEYDEAAAFYNQTSANYAYTIFKVVELMCARYIERRTRNSDKVGLEIYKARLKQLYHTRDFWKQQAGVQDTPLTYSFIDTGLDAVDPDA